MKIGSKMVFEFFSSNASHFFTSVTQSWSLMPPPFIIKEYKKKSCFSNFWISAKLSPDSFLPVEIGKGEPARISEVHFQHFRRLAFMGSDQGAQVFTTNQGPRVLISSRALATLKAFLVNQSSQNWIKFHFCHFFSLRGENGKRDAPRNFHFVRSLLPLPTYCCKFYELHLGPTTFMAF